MNLYFMYKNSIHTSRRMQCASIGKASDFVLCREMIAIMRIIYNTQMHLNVVFSVKPGCTCTNYKTLQG